MKNLKDNFFDVFNNKIIESESKDHIQNIEKDVNAHLSKIGMNKIEYSVDTIELNMIIKSLRNNKSVGHAGISNEMIKYGGERHLLGCVKLILEKIFQFGNMPTYFNTGKIIPIVKDENQSTCDISNIRPITISDTLSNIFEKIVLFELEKNNLNHKLQFGFKKNSSCNHAIFVLKETATFYNCRSKCLYACAIDASKAFDKINRFALMYKLITKVEASVWRALYIYYSISIAYISNESEISNTFKTSIGVKQGGPLSPRLFSIYVEDLIEELLKTELGSSVCGLKTGVIMYADDLLVMSDDIKKLQEMLVLVEEYCNKWEIKINVQKTQFIQFGNFPNKEITSHLKLSGQKVEKVNKLKYLGVWLDSKLTADYQIEEKKLSATRAFNSLRKIGIANSETSATMKSFLFKVYCRPILHYGLENLTLTKKDLKKIQTIESTLIKNSLNLSKTTRSTKLLMAMNIELAINRISLAKLKFFQRLLRNDVTKNLIEIISEEYQKSNENVRLKNKSLVGHIIEFTDKNVLFKDLRSKIIGEKIKEFKSEEKKVKKLGNCGVVDSIRICLDKRTEKNDKILKLLVQSYEKIPNRVVTRKSH